MSDQKASLMTMRPHSSSDLELAKKDKPIAPNKPKMESHLSKKNVSPEFPREPLSTFLEQEELTKKAALHMSSITEKDGMRSRPKKMLRLVFKGLASQEATELTHLVEMVLELMVFIVLD